MTDNQKQAIDAIKKATGWDAEPSSQGAKVQRPNVTSIYVWWSRSDKWKCEIDPRGWIGEGPTPEAAIEAVLPRYRAHVAALAADILPGWPRLEWESRRWQHHLCFFMDNFRVELFFVYNSANGWTVWRRHDADNEVIACRVTAPVAAAHVAEWCAANLPSLYLPPFPGDSK